MEAKTQYGRYMASATNLLRRVDDSVTWRHYPLGQRNYVGLSA